MHAAPNLRVSCIISKLHERLHKYGADGAFLSIGNMRQKDRRCTQQDPHLVEEMREKRMRRENNGEISAPPSQ